MAGQGKTGPGYRCITQRSCLSTYTPVRLYYILISTTKGKITGVQSDNEPQHSRVLKIASLLKACTRTSSKCRIAVWFVASVSLTSCTTRQRKERALLVCHHLRPGLLTAETCPIPAGQGDHVKGFLLLLNPILSNSLMQKLTNTLNYSFLSLLNSGTPYLLLYSQLHATLTFCVTFDQLPLSHKNPYVLKTLF